MGTEPTVAEVRRLLAETNSGLQQLQDFMDENAIEPVAVRFPRGYLRTAYQQRKRVPFLDGRYRLQSNVAYTLMLCDTLSWLLLRTDLASTARDMVVKASITFMGSVLEACLLYRCRHATLSKRQRNSRGRLDCLAAQGVISGPLAEDCKCLWETRNRIHLFELDGSEFHEYTEDHYPRARRALEGFLQALSVEERA